MVFKEKYNKDAPFFNYNTYIVLTRSRHKYVKTVYNATLRRGEQQYILQCHCLIFILNIGFFP